MITSTDQLNRQIILSEYPRKIISVVPSQTELLFSLGLENEVVGITKFCVHPQSWFRIKEHVGGTKKLNLSKIKAINPDLIIANREENTKEDIDSLSRDYPVWVSDVKTLEDALAMINSIGLLVNRKKEAERLSNKITFEFEKLKEQTYLPIPAIYVIWKNPYMAAGSDTFISQMMEKAGFINVLAGVHRYPEITPEEIKSYNPQLVILSSEPYPFKEKDVTELIGNLQGINVIQANGEMFSWYGSHLLYSPDFFLSLRKQINVNSQK